MSVKQRSVRIGADVGGTFTDVILMDGEGNIRSYKLPSTPPDYEQAVLSGIEHLLAQTKGPEDTFGEVAHGTTVATNAVLEHRGARTALITTQGFRDVLELRRIRAPQMYDIFFEKPPSLVERYLRFELSERLSATGEVLRPLVEAELWNLKELLEREDVESVAVCLLHAYAFPEHEIAVGRFLREHLPRLPVSLSCEVLRERKEYERTATTVVNAYVRPIMERYLGSLRRGLSAMRIDAPLLIMQSAGGLTPEEDAVLRPVYVLESGPAAGVLAARDTALRAGLSNVITLDIGGTTAKTAMIEEGRIAYSSEYEVGASLSAGNRLVSGGGELIRAPSIDIVEVGAGGGSIAFLDRAGGLRVGPRSAGAVPGPACYQRGGTEPTVTDANVVLGYIRPGELADGEIRIDPESARRAIHDRIAVPLGLDLLRAAEGIHRIANARTMRALRAVSTERGRDPRDFALIAFGGSGPIHAAGLAQELSVPRILIPPLPGLFSVMGLLSSGIEHHDVRSCLLSGTSLSAVAMGELQGEMQERLLDRFAAEGYEANQVALNWNVDVRFQGQASEIRLRLGEEKVTESGLRQLQAAFEEEHERLYGHRSDPDNPVQVVAVRLIGRAAAPDVTSRPPAEGMLDRTLGSGQRLAYFGPSWGSIETPVVLRSALAPGMEGPLLVDEYDSTTVVPPGMRAELDELGSIVLRPGPPRM
jgi:N-methylhydantoinase A